MAKQRSSFSEQAAFGLIFVILGAALWGTGGIAAKFLGQEIDIAPLTIAFFRVALASPAMILVTLLIPNVSWRWPNKREGLFLILMAATQAGYQGFYFTGVNAIGVTQTTLIALCGCPVLLTLLAILFLKERVGWIGLAAIPLAILGTALLIMGPETGLGGRLGAGQARHMGYGAAACAALSFALFTLFSQQIARHFHPAQMITLAFALGCLFLLPLTSWETPVQAFSWQAWAIIAYLGLVPTALAYALFFAGVHRVTATAAGVLVLVEPLVASVLAGWLFDEALGPYGLFGAGLLLLAVFLVSRKRSCKT